MDDKVSSTDHRGDYLAAAAHKRHHGGRQYAGVATSPAASMNMNASATGNGGGSSGEASAISNNLLHTMRRYSGFSAYNNSKLKKTATSANAASNNSNNTTSAFELYSIRDRSDATAKRAFRVQVPVRMMYTISAVFLIIPILVFGWKEVHMPGVHVHDVSQQGGGRPAMRLRNGVSSREDSNWMEEHLVSDTEQGEGILPLSSATTVNETMPSPISDEAFLPVHNNNNITEEAELLVNVQEQDALPNNITDLSIAYDIPSDFDIAAEAVEAEIILDAESSQETFEAGEDMEGVELGNGME